MRTKLIKLFYVLIFLFPTYTLRDISAFIHISKEFSSLKPIEVKVEEKVALVEPKEEKQEGKVIYENYCVSCHYFKSKEVGPPLREVLPKYKGDLARLKNFIKKPFRVNPEYPPMPELGLSDRKIDLVVIYIMEDLKKYTE
ncbi:MAG: c-type cytochrome [Candidatus Hydrothermales bacterium]